MFAAAREAEANDRRSSEAMHQSQLAMALCLLGQYLISCLCKPQEGLFLAAKALRFVKIEREWRRNNAPPPEE